VTTTVSRTAIVLALLAAAGCGPRGESTPASTPTPVPIATGDYPEYGYAPDLTWLAGRIATTLRGGICTYVVFATRAGAPWGGKFALRAVPGALDGVRPGDMVVVRGSTSSASSRDCGAADFDVTSIELH
jgi:hypothetical protein